MKEHSFLYPRKICCLLCRVLSLPGMTFIPISKLLLKINVFAVRLYQMADIGFFGLGFFPNLQRMSHPEFSIGFISSCPSPYQEKKPQTTPKAPKTSSTLSQPFMSMLESLQQTSQPFGYTLGGSDSWQREEKASLS